VRGLAIITAMFNVWSSKGDTALLTGSAYLVRLIDYRRHANHAIRLGAIWRLYVCFLLYLHFARHGLQQYMLLMREEYSCRWARRDIVSPNYRIMTASFSGTPHTHYPPRAIGTRNFRQVHPRNSHVMVSHIPQLPRRFRDT
jgi:hypothetical protein